MPEAIDEQKRIHLDCMTHWFDLERWSWEISKYAGFARNTGEGLEEARDVLLDEVSSWLKNKGGNVQEIPNEATDIQCECKESAR
jgi:O-succinylbenzoate synthase